MQVSINALSVQTVDGFLLGASIIRPIETTELNGVIMISSGTGVKKEFYQNFGKFLAEHNYAVITYDYRGIGASRPIRLKGFEARMLDWGQKDMYSIIEWIDQNYSGKSIYAIGHSNGGQQIGFLSNHAKISKILMVGASTGYWRDLKAPYKYFTAFVWYVFVPLTTFAIGYAPASWFRLGEDLPKNVAREWRNWCTSSMYFGKYFGRAIKRTFFSQVNAPIYSLYAEDDAIATDKTVEALLQYYSNASIVKEKIMLHDVGVRRIGHFGFFSRSVKDKLWKKALDFFEN